MFSKCPVVVIAPESTAEHWNEGNWCRETSSGILQQSKVFPTQWQITAQAEASAKNFCPFLSLTSPSILERPISQCFLHLIPLISDPFALWLKGRAWPECPPPQKNKRKLEFEAWDPALGKPQVTVRSPPSPSVYCRVSQGLGTIVREQCSIFIKEESTVNKFTNWEKHSFLISLFVTHSVRASCYYWSEIPCWLVF